LVARAIHVGSERSGKKFVITNCSAFNDNLLDSELFGHKRGAFTGAVSTSPGLFEVTRHLACVDPRALDRRLSRTNFALFVFESVSG
jgi:transcriptional regulator of aromatic amino acid metabolism